ncbi:MAG: type I methionyl aminopeptidase [Firmicutes bacterium]|nr:type I methionyl aminopeptidase [Bacillota bacterium]
MIPIKNAKEIAKMRAVNAIVAAAHRHIQGYLSAGITAKEIDTIVEDFILSQGAKPNFKNLYRYPAATCISINDAVIHGIPKAVALKDGDIVSLDFGAVLDGWHGDAARTYAIGSVSNSAQRLIEVAKECFYQGLAEARAGRRVGDISYAVQAHAEKNGCSIVRSYSGHGIGRRLHEEPAIPNYGAKGQGALLKRGMTLAIEPMINLGGFEVKVDADGWTVRTQDGFLSAHYENTVLITDGEPEILSR